MNSIFNIKRIGLLYRQFYYLHYKKMLIAVAAFVGLIAVVHTFAHIVNIHDLNSIKREYFLAVFLFIFIGGLLLWTGYAFPGFRTKEKSFNYLILPASITEKFIFELVNRVLLFILVVPLIYWSVTNLITWSFHQYVPDYENYTFSYYIPWDKLGIKEMFLVSSLSLLLFTISFAGASYFKTLPIVKTILVVFIIIFVYSGFLYFILETLGLSQYNPKNGRVLFMNSADDAIWAGIGASVIVHIFLLGISFFRLKETEV